MSTTEKNLLVVRFSSLGDIALLYPVLYSFLKQNPDYSITLVTKSNYAPLFQNMSRIAVYPVDFASQFKGIIGLFSLSRRLVNAFSFDLVLDMHQVLRTHFLNFFLKLAGKKIIRIEKFREMRNRLTRKENKVRIQVPHTTTRYLSVFNRAGFPIELESAPFLPIEQDYEAVQFLEEKEGIDTKKWIGIAPFAKWPTKVWPREKMEQLIQKLTSENNCAIFLFGAGKDELDIMDLWVKKFSNVFSCRSISGLFGEIKLMSKLHLFLSMDSANMHLASLSGIPVVTIWGPTHSAVGFSAINQTGERMIEIPESELECRPCSSFGDKPCWRGDHACLERISVEKVYQKISQILQ